MRFLSCFPLYWLCALLTWSGAPAGAAEPFSNERLVLRHGEELVGASLEINEGLVLWQFPDGALVTIPLSEVERLEFNHPIETAAMAEPPAPALTDPDDVLGEATEADWTRNLPILPQIQQSYDTVAATAARWTQRLQVGGQFNEGNSRTSLIDVAGVFEQNTPEQMRQVDAGGQFGRNRTQTTANRWWINGNFDWPIEEKWIAFVTNKNEYNEPAHLNYRGTVSGGYGYRFFFEDKRRLIVRFGPAYTLEVFGSPSKTRQTPDVFGEVEMRWQVFDRTSFDQKTRVQPSMLDFELVRINSTTGLVVDLDDRWKLRLGFLYQLNTVPNPGRVPSDYTTTVSLMYVRK